MFVLSSLLAISSIVSNAGEEARPVRHPQVGVCVHLRLLDRIHSQDPKTKVLSVDKAIELIEESGAKWIREDFFWARVETSKGVYKMPDQYVGWINRLHEKGIGIAALFNTGHQGNKLYENPFDREAFAKAAAWFAKETKGKVEVIEILNEPNNSLFMKHFGGVWNGKERDGGVSPWIREYVGFVNLAAKQIKQVNPHVKVIGGGGGPLPATYRGIELGFAPEVDGVTWHAYSPVGVPEIIPYASTASIQKRDGLAVADEKGTFASAARMLREKMAKHNGPRGIWINEWGYPTYTVTNPKKSRFMGYTHSAQAKYILRRLVESLVVTDYTFVYTFTDHRPDLNDAEANFGIIDLYGNPKPSYYAYQRAARALADYRAVEARPVDKRPLPDVEVKVFAIANRADRHPFVWDDAKLESLGKIANYLFSNKKGEPLLALWSTERADGDFTSVVADVEISIKKPVAGIRAYSPIDGKTRDVVFTKSGDTLRIEKMEIPDSPLLLTFH